MISFFSGINLSNLSLLFIWALISSFGIPGALVAEIGAGALSNNLLDIFFVILTVAVGSILGDIFAYEIARKFSPYLSKKLSKFKFFREGEPEARQILKKYEFLSVFLTRFIFTGLDSVVNYIGGFEKINRKKFILAVIPGEILYASIYTILGFFFKEIFIDLSNVIEDTITSAVLILIVGLLVYVYLKKRKKRKLRLIENKESETTSPNLGIN